MNKSQSIDRWFKKNERTFIFSRGFSDFYSIHIWLVQWQDVNILCPSLTAHTIVAIVIDSSFVEHVEPAIYLFVFGFLLRFGIQFMLRQTFLFVITIVCIIRNTKVLRNVTFFEYITKEIIFETLSVCTTSYLSWREDITLICFFFSS